jgi:hypothetical protein
MARIGLSIALLLTLYSPPSVNLTAADVPSPEWTKDLIIYYAATKVFTSPHGPASGTFNSFREKLPYLQELGINGVWFAGYSLGDPHHFYNIWTEYSVIRPDELDPSLGTAEEFKGMIDDAHRHGIKIFLDAVTHGVMQNSPLIKEHPDWFKGSTWNMVDYDWYGNHPDLDSWWVKTWTDYVTKFGVDGYRLDVNVYRPDLWKKIRENAAAAGHPIIIFEEFNDPIDGVSDFSEHRRALNHDSEPVSQILAWDAAGYYRRISGRQGYYWVEIDFADGSKAAGSTSGEGTLRVHFDGLTVDKVGRRWGTDGKEPDGLPDIQLTIDNASTDKQIGNVIVNDDTGEQWQLQAKEWGQRFAVVEGTAPTLRIYVAINGHGWSTFQLSDPDNGWEGFPTHLNPFAIQGSRYLFGYAGLFNPMIPVFMSGEEFDASHKPVPWESPNLYDHKDPGKGAWLGGNMLQWDELEQTEHRAMFEDVKKMIAIRKQEADVLGPFPPGTTEYRIMAVPHIPYEPVPVPYLRWNSKRAIVVVANPYVNREVTVKLLVPLEAIGMGTWHSFRVTNLMTGQSEAVSAADLGLYSCEVKRDKTPGGGVQVLKIEPID